MKSHVLRPGSVSKKKKSQTLRLNSERVVSLITKIPLKTKLWKLKTQCVFSFHNSSLKNQRIEGWKQKQETKSKWTSQPWVSLFLSYELWKQSYELWKQQIQTAP